jgi:hypothetical protein
MNFYEQTEQGLIITLYSFFTLIPGLPLQESGTGYKAIKQFLTYLTQGKYYSGDQTEGNEIFRACGTYIAEKKCIQNLGRETSGDRPFRRHRHIWEHNIKKLLKK